MKTDSNITQDKDKPYDNAHDLNRLTGCAVDPDSENDNDEGPNALQEYIQSLSDPDKELIKTIPLNDIDTVLQLDDEKFSNLINNSLSIRELGSHTNGI
jgi:hypothetical protein